MLATILLFLITIIVEKWVCRWNWWVWVRITPEFISLQAVRHQQRGGIHHSCLAGRLMSGYVLHYLSPSINAFLVLGYLFISKLWKNQRFVTRYCYFQETGLEKWKWCVISKKFWWKLPFSSITIYCVFHKIIFNYSYQNRHNGYLGQQIDGQLN